jgi:membrane carboxypeptidase/penicillin-binding protein PbpC
MEGLTEQNKYNHFVHPLRSIVTPPKESLAKWDELNKERKVVGIGGIDAHAHKVNVMGFVEVEVFPYKILFKSIRTHILVDKQFDKSNDNIEEAKKQIYSSLENGRCFISNYYRGDAKGFKCFASDEKNEFQMGDTVKVSKKLKLKVTLPNGKAEIRLFHNGTQIESAQNSHVEFNIREKGQYRVEVFKNGNAWIFSNHIRIEN